MSVILDPLVPILYLAGGGVFWAALRHFEFENILSILTVADPPHRNCSAWLRLKLNHKGFVDLFYDFWIQKLHHFYNFWMQKFFCPFLQFLDSEMAVFLWFLDPETAPFLQFVDPEICWSIFTISGSRNCSIFAVSGSRNCTISAISGSSNEPARMFLLVCYQPMG